jgi:hypothetical protein
MRHPARRAAPQRLLPAEALALALALALVQVLVQVQVQVQELAQVQPLG